jgi:peptide chain release factor 2
LSSHSTCSGGTFDVDASEKRLLELSQLANDPGLWNDRTRAQGVMKEKNYLEHSLGRFHAIKDSLASHIELIAMAEGENDAAMLSEAEGGIDQLALEAKKLETEGLFSGEADMNDCFIEVHAGAGGTESCDWAAMLMRMYMKWADSHGFKTEIIEESSGDEAGIKSATFKVMGASAYGWAKTESGVHRLVRISPFDSAKRRHTSFASVWVYPQVDDNIEITIEDKDLRVDTYRASGAGGQHVNKTDSAIRITHIPTGIVVQCQTNRSQHRNRDEAYKMLRARLYEMELRKREESIQAQHDAKSDNSWGSQIRSYVLHPYQMVKDLRTGVETSDTDGVLDGDLDEFMSAALAQRMTGQGRQAKKKQGE